MIILMIILRVILTHVFIPTLFSPFTTTICISLSDPLLTPIPLPSLTFNPFYSLLPSLCSPSLPISTSCFSFTHLPLSTLLSLLSDVAMYALKESNALVEEWMLLANITGTGHRCTALPCTTLPCPALYCTTLPCTTLHCLALPCINNHLCPALHIMHL